MKQPKLKGGSFLDEVHTTPCSPDRFDVWWLGQSGFLIRYNGKHLLFDPYLSDSLTKKYQDTDKPHVRMTELVIEPERLDFIDIITSTHNHTDHLDAETILPLKQVNPNLKLVLPKANIEFAAGRLNDQRDWFLGMNEGDEMDVDGFVFHAIPAAHEEFEMDEQGNHRFLGYIVQFGQWIVYHSGDTICYDGMEERLRAFTIDLAFLPINGSKPERRVSGNMWGREAARLAKDTGIRCVIPCHFDMFAFNTVAPDEFIAEAQHLGIHYKVLENGDGAHSYELVIK